MLGARLKALGISTLIVDKASEVGDAWKKRYDVSIPGRLSVDILNLPS